MSKIKNLHLLAAVVVLSVISAILCMALAMGENSHGNRLENLHTELKESREKHESIEKEIGEKIDTLNSKFDGINKSTQTRIDALRLELQNKINEITDEDQKELKDLKKEMDILKATIQPKIESLQIELKTTKDKLTEASNKIDQLEASLKKLALKVDK